MLPKVTLAFKGGGGTKSKKFKIWEDDTFAKSFKEYAKISGFVNI
jgi:hypothetical protein